MSRLAASIVTFNPDIQTLTRLVDILKCQVEAVIVVDNASERESANAMKCWCADSQVELVLNEENQGVSAGHNQAVVIAEEKGFTHLAMFDQDSLPSDTMLLDLLRVEERLRAGNAKIAAVGPQYFDPRHRVPAPFIRLEQGWVRKLQCRDQSEVMPVDYLITSGTLIRLEVLREIGGFDESLFIDYIDIEWCLRAKAKGYQSYGVCAAKMHHSLGDEVVSWQNGKRLVSVRTPLRNYYLFRNAVLLYRRPYIAWIWCLNDAYRLLLKLGFFSLVTPPRLTNLKMMLLGLYHGICGRSGRYTRSLRSS